MKKYFYLSAMFLALTMTFTSCSDDDDSEEQVNKAEKVAGTYEGYAYAAFSYISYVLPYTDESVTVTANSDGTANVNYVNDTWGEFTAENCTVTGSDHDCYVIETTGKVSMTGHGGTVSTYDFTGQATCYGDLTMIYQISVPGLMGGTNIVFKTNNGTDGAPDSFYLVGEFEGNTSAAFAYGTLTYEADELTATTNADGTMNVTYTNDGSHSTSSSITLGFGTFKDTNMDLTDNGDGTYTMSGSGTVSLSMSGSEAKEYTYTSEYQISEEGITANYTLPIMGSTVLTFTSTSKK